MILLTDKKVDKVAFAGGCFWCMVKPFKEWDGIYDVVSGYMGGHTENPLYEDVKNGETGHLEVVEITYDSSVFPFEKLLDVFWQQIDPTDADGQFQDRGHSYSTAIFYSTDEQREIAQISKERLGKSGIFTKPIVTPIRPIERFYRAEEYHQNYYEKEQKHYNDDRAKSGRDEFISNHWSIDK